MDQTTQPDAATPENTPPNPVEIPTAQPDQAAVVETSAESVAEPTVEPTTTAAAGEVTPPQPERSTAGKVLNWMLGPSTKVGKVMRPVLRWTALVEGLLAIGLLFGFFLLYAPTQQKLETALNNLAAVNAVLDQTNADLAGAKQTIADQKSDLIKAQALQVVYQLKDSVSTIRLDLVNKQGPKAKADLETAQNALTQLVTLAKGSEHEAAVDLVQTRMKLVTDEYAVDAVQAQKDLETVYTQLGEIEKALLAGD